MLPFLHLGPFYSPSFIFMHKQNELDRTDEYPHFLDQTIE